MRHQTSKSWLDNDFTLHLIRQNNVHLTVEPGRVRTKCRHLAPYAHASVVQLKTTEFSY